MKIIENFLPSDTFKEIQSLMMGDLIPWYYNPTITTGGEESIDRFQFTHVFVYDTNVESYLYPSMEPLVNQINPIKMIRMKANLGTKTSEHNIGGYHTDLTYPCTTAVFYLNSNNGYTMFEDGTKVESVENTFVEFDSSLSHTGVSQTNTQVRCVLNLNYIK